MQENEVLVAPIPQEFLFVPLIGALIVGLCLGAHLMRVRRYGMRMPIGAIAWSACIIALLLGLATLCGLGMVTSDMLYLIQCVVVLTITGAILARRERTFLLLESLDESGMVQHGASQTIRIVRDIAIILIGSELARRALEVPWNNKMDSISIDHVAIEFALIATAAFIAYFVAQRRAFGPALVFAACAAIGIIEHFIFEFRRAAILPMDVLALQTAAGVGNQYTYVLDTSDIKAIMYMGLAFLCVSFIRPARTKDMHSFVLNLCWNIPLALGFALALNWWIASPSYRNDYGLDILYWDTEVSYKEQGFLPSFLTAVEDLPLDVPTDYSTQRAEKLTKDYAAKADALPERSKRRAASTKQFEEVKPSIVIVMNETFADLSRLNKLGDVYEGPKFFQTGFDDAISRGQLGMSVYGAGTCNSEFECLTGNSCAFLGSGKYPYQMFTFDEIPNMARQMAALGYTTSAIHPNDQDNWNRRVTYKGMGFNEFYNTNNSFEDAPDFHSGKTDKSTYEKILEILASEDKPQFVFDVTMQNHGGYGQNNIPPERYVNYEFPGIDPVVAGQLNEYLACIQASDEDLEWFVNELKNLDRPVILAFFGDHHCKMADVPNDVYFPDEDALQHQARVYKTEYVIWANYDIAETDQSGRTEDFGSDLIGTLTLDYAGAPLDDFQAAQIGVHQRLQSISAIGYESADGIWHTPGTEPSLDVTYRDMQTIDFLHFGSKILDEKQVEQRLKEQKREEEKQQDEEEQAAK